MRNHERWFWGILFLLGAALLVASRMGWITYELGFWTIVTIGVGVVIFVKSLVYGSFPGMIFPLAVAAIIFAEPLGIEELSPWTIIGVAVLLSAGLSLIFHKNPHDRWRKHVTYSHFDGDSDQDDDEKDFNDMIEESIKNKKSGTSDEADVVEGEYSEVDKGKTYVIDDEDDDDEDDNDEFEDDEFDDAEFEDEDDEDDEENESYRGNSHYRRHNRYSNTGERKVVINSQMNSVVRYLKSDRLEEVIINNTFGETNVYFDQVRIPKELNVIVTNKFGDVELYMPREWDVRVKAGSTFGSMDETGRKSTKKGPVVYVRGTNSFGDFTIRYI